MSFETEGILHKVFDTESKTATFQAREFVIRHEGTYPQFIKFQLTQDRCDLVDSFKEGDKIKVSFDLKGREWNEKYFTNLNAWKIDAVAGDNQEAPPVDQMMPNEEAPFETKLEPIAQASGDDGAQKLTAEDFDDLPF